MSRHGEAMPSGHGVSTEEGISERGEKGSKFTGEPLVNYLDRYVPQLVSACDFPRSISSLWFLERNPLCLRVCFPLGK